MRSPGGSQGCEVRRGARGVGRAGPTESLVEQLAGGRPMSFFGSRRWGSGHRERPRPAPRRPRLAAAEFYPGPAGTPPPRRHDGSRRLGAVTTGGQREGEGSSLDHRGRAQRQRGGRPPRNDAAAPPLSGGRGAAAAPPERGPIADASRVHRVSGTATPSAPGGAPPRPTRRAVSASPEQPQRGRHDDGQHRAPVRPVTSLVGPPRQRNSARPRPRGQGRRSARNGGIGDRTCALTPQRRSRVVPSSGRPPSSGRGWRRGPPGGPEPGGHGGIPTRRSTLADESAVGRPRGRSRCARPGEANPAALVCHGLAGEEAQGQVAVGLVTAVDQARHPASKGTRCSRREPGQPTAGSHPQHRSPPASRAHRTGAARRLAPRSGPPADRRPRDRALGGLRGFTPKTYPRRERSEPVGQPAADGAGAAVEAQNGGRSTRPGDREGGDASPLARVPFVSCRWRRETGPRRDEVGPRLVDAVVGAPVLVGHHSTCGGVWRSRRGSWARAHIGVEGHSARRRRRAVPPVPRRGDADRSAGGGVRAPDQVVHQLQPPRMKGTWARTEHVHRVRVRRSPASLPSIGCPDARALQSRVGPPWTRRPRLRAASSARRGRGAELVLRQIASAWPTGAGGGRAHDL